MNNSVFSYYDELRSANARLEEARKLEIYENIPQIKEIDLELREISFSLVACCFNKEIDVESLVEKARLRTAELRAKKKDLLVYKGYPEDYLDEIYNCKLCRDSGAVDGKPCICYNALKLKRSYNASNLSQLMDSQNFDNFNYDLYSDKELDREHPLYNPFLKSLRDYMRQVVALLKDFIDADTQRGAYIYGNTGVGKTYLCSSVCKYAIERGLSVLYYSMNNYLEICQNYRFDKTGDFKETYEAYKSLFETDLLILDDLGTEVGGKFVNSELFSIINERLAAGKKMLISSNINPKGISEHFGERIASRILGEYSLYYIDGYDLRVR